MEKYNYFKVAIGDVTQDMLDEATSKNIFKLKYNVAGTHVILKVPALMACYAFCDAGITLLTKAEAKAELAAVAWDADYT